MPDYFQAMGIPLSKGRPFSDADNKNSPGVVIISETTARRFWPNEDPVGKRIWLGPPQNLLPRPPRPGFAFPRLTIVGVAGDVKQASLDQQMGPDIYAPILQNDEPWRSMYIEVRTNSSEPLNLAGMVRSQVWAVDKDQSISQVGTMEEIIDKSLNQPRFTMFLLTIFGALSVSLAAVGIYGVISYSVSQRTQELAIRMALGARPLGIIGLVVGQEIIYVIVGVALGLMAAFLTMPVMKTLLFGISTSDPLIFVLASALLAFVALVASYIPARRAARLDPLKALRYE